MAAKLTLYALYTLAGHSPTSSFAIMFPNSMQTGDLTSGPMPTSICLSWLKYEAETPECEGKQQLSVYVKTFTCYQYINFYQKPVLTV